MKLKALRGRALLGYEWKSRLFHFSVKALERKGRDLKRKRAKKTLMTSLPGAS